MNYSFNEARPALEVFHTGDSVRAYDFLGAHLVNRNRQKRSGVPCVGANRKERFGCRRF